MFDIQTEGKKHKFNPRPLFPEAGSNAVVLGGMTPYGGSQLERVELCDSVNSNFSTFNTELITGDPGWLAASPIF